MRSLLPTIQSRCLHLRFRPLSADWIESVLEARGVSKPVARLAAATADGSLGWALQHFEAPLDSPGGGKSAVDLTELGRLRAVALDLFVDMKENAVLGPLRKGRMDRDRPRFLAAVSLALHYYRDLLRYHLLGDRAELANEDLRKRVADDARRIPVASVTRRVRLLEEIAESVQTNVTIPYAVASAQYRMTEAA